MPSLEEARAAKARLEDLYSNRADLSFAIGLPQFTQESDDDFFVMVGLHEMFPTHVNGVRVDVSYVGPVSAQAPAKAPERPAEPLSTRFGDPHTDRAAMAVEGLSDTYEGHAPDEPNVW